MLLMYVSLRLQLQIREFTITLHHQITTLHKPGDTRDPAGTDCCLVCVCERHDADRQEPQGR